MGFEPTMADLQSAALDHLATAPCVDRQSLALFPPMHWQSLPKRRNRTSQKNHRQTAPAFPIRMSNRPKRFAGNRTISGGGPARREVPAKTDGGGVIIHDDAAVEDEECIMNNAAPIDAPLGIRSHTPARPPRARSSPRRRRIVKASFGVSSPASHSSGRSSLWYAGGVKRRFAAMPRNETSRVAHPEAQTTDGTAATDASD